LDGGISASVYGMAAVGEDLMVGSFNGLDIWLGPFGDYA